MRLVRYSHLLESLLATTTSVECLLEVSTHLDLPVAKSKSVSSHPKASHNLPLLRRCHPLKPSSQSPSAPTLLVMWLDVASFVAHWSSSQIKIVLLQSYPCNLLLQCRSSRPYPPPVPLLRHQGREPHRTSLQTPPLAFVAPVQPNPSLGSLVQASTTTKLTVFLLERSIVKCLVCTTSTHLWYPGASCVISSIVLL